MFNAHCLLFKPAVDYIITLGPRILGFASIPHPDAVLRYVYGFSLFLTMAFAHFLPDPWSPWRIMIHC